MPCTSLPTDPADERSGRDQDKERNLDAAQPGLFLIHRPMPRTRRSGVRRAPAVLGQHVRMAGCTAALQTLAAGDALAHALHGLPGEVHGHGRDMRLATTRYIMA
jgi:hypothetical protein